jgi:hypothetical protein
VGFPRDVDTGLCRDLMQRSRCEGLFVVGGAEVAQRGVAAPVVVEGDPPEDVAAGVGFAGPVGRRAVSSAASTPATIQRFLVSGGLSLVTGATVNNYVFPAESTPWAGQWSKFHPATPPTTAIPIRAPAAVHARPAASSRTSPVRCHCRRRAPTARVPAGGRGRRAPGSGAAVVRARRLS